MPPMMPTRPQMNPNAPPMAPQGPQGRPGMGGPPPMAQQQPQAPLMDASALQRQAVIKMLTQSAGPSPDGGMPAQFTMPKPYAPPMPNTGRGRGPY